MLIGSREFQHKIAESTSTIVLRYAEHSASLERYVTQGRKVTPRITGLANTSAKGGEFVSFMANFHFSSGDGEGKGGKNSFEAALGVF